MNADALLLIAHGTPDPAGNAETLELAAKIESAAGIPVRTGFIEHAEPDVPSTIDAMAAEGFRRIVAAPVILSAAGHVKGDIPEFLDAARERHPELSFEIAPHIGVHPALIEILDDRLRACEAGETSVAREDTALVFLGRGSSDPDANSDIYKIARLLWEGRGFRSVHVGFIGVTFPTVQEAIRQATLMQPKRIIVQPFFLFLGVLLTRIGKIVEESRTLYPGIEFLLTAHLGPDARLAEVIIEHGRSAACSEEMRAG